MRLLLIATIFGWGGVWAVWAWRIASGRGWRERQLRLLTFSWETLPHPLPLSVQCILLVLHLAGVALLAHQFGLPYFQILGLSVILYLPLLIDAGLRRPRGLYLEVMSPLYVAYGVAAVRWVVGNILAIPLYNPFDYPNALNAALSMEAWLIAAATYSLLAQGYIILWRHNAQEKFLTLAGVVLLLFTLVWAGGEYFGHRTRGVTGSDPYAYAQMAVDVVERGTPLHLFPLFPQMNTLGISWWPVVHVGYRLPLDGEGNAASVWPVGGSLLLALGYGAGGEEGLYITTPFLGILTAVALFFLALEILRELPLGERVWVGAGAAFVLATSYEQIDRLLVPMADASAQLFTTLTVLLALVAVRKNHLLSAALAGLAWGMAYWIRHTQLVLGMSVLLVIGLSGLGARRAYRLIAVFAFSGLLLALPDLAYHQSAFGNFWTPESEELVHFSLANIQVTLPLMLQRLLESNEFGYLLPLLLWGGWRMYRAQPTIFWVLISWVLAILLVHLPYRFLRLRDLLSIYPALCFFIGYGLLDLFRRAAVREAAIIGAGAIFLLLLLPALRVRILLLRPFSTYTATFGYMTAEQHQSFAALAQLVPEDGVIGTSLNGGAIDLYAERDAFRPEVWSGSEFAIFLQEMERLGRPVYILDDGDSLSPALEYTRSAHRLVKVAELAVPIFGEGASGALYRIERRG